MKKVISIILTLLLLMSVFPISALSEESDTLPDFGLPIISIHMEQPASTITKEEQLPATFSMFTGDEYEIIEEEITIKGRGNSTWNAPKKPYQIKFDSKTDILGMGKAKKWVLLANYYDQTSVRNYLAFDLALKLGMDYTPLMRFVDVYINDNYMGNYIICDKIEMGSTRVDISDDGLILEVNSLLDENYNFTTKNGVPFSIKEPEYDPISDDMSEEEKQEITDAVASVEAEIAAIENLIYAHNTSCFDYIDMDSFVDWYIVNELYKNVDASFKKSCYMYRDAEGKFFMGPVWDFDLALGGTGSDDMRDPSRFHVSSQRWYRQLRLIPEFETALKARWTQIRNDGTLDSFFDTLDETLELIDTSAKENLKLWPFKKFDNSYGESILSVGMDVDFIREFYASRLIWMDASLNNSPSRISNAETMIRSLPETLMLSSLRYIDTVNDYISSLESDEVSQIDEALLEKLRATNEKYDNLDKTLGIKSIDLSSQVVYKNERITFSCITSADIEKIAVLNENSSALGKSNETLTLLDDGNILWTFSCSFGSVGTREIRVKAISENEYETVPFKLVILKENQAKPDKTSLISLVEEAETIDLSNKTDESVQAFNEALSQAKQTIFDPLALQAAINSSLNSLKNAIESLVDVKTAYSIIDVNGKPYDGEIIDAVVNENTSIKIETPLGVKSIMIVNEAGKYVTKSTVGVGENSLIWNVALKVGTRGNRLLSLRADYGNGYESTDLIIPVNVKKAPVVVSEPGIISVTVDSNTTAVNKPVTVTVITSNGITSAKDIGFFNENGVGVSKTLISSKAQGDNIVWEFKFSVGTKGQRTFAVKYADENRIWHESKSFELTVVK